MSSRTKPAHADLRRDPEFAVLWAAMAEADWLEFTGDGDSPQLRELMAGHRRLVVRRRVRLILVAVFSALALGVCGLLLLR